MNMFLLTEKKKQIRDEKTNIIAIMNNNTIFFFISTQFYTILKCHTDSHKTHDNIHNALQVAHNLKTKTFILCFL